MAFQLTQTAENLLNQTNVEPIIILEVEGLPVIFGTGAIERIWGFDEGFTFDSGLFFDGVVEDENSRDWISLSGTTQNITNQVEIEEGGSGSVQKFNVRIIDQGGAVTDYFTPGNYIDDPLATEANVYIGFKGGAHPRDSVRIFNSVIDQVQFNSGNVNISCAHPDQLKRQDIFQQQQAKLDGAIDDSVTSILLDDASKFNSPTDTLATYVVIEDEIIQYTGISTNTLTGCVRGSLNTIAVLHEDESELLSFLTLSGNPIDVALKIMLSNRTESVASGNVKNFAQVETTTLNTAAIFIEDTTFIDDNGLVAGDLMSTTGATIPGNNQTDFAIVSWSITDTGTIIVTDTTFSIEVDSGASFTSKSQYNVLPDGLGMKPSQVDVEQHEFLSETYSTSFPDYLFYIKDTINAKDFLAKEVYYPAGLYSIVRKGRSSVQFTTPPLNDSQVVQLDEDLVMNPSQLSISRSINKYYYNSVVYKYNVDSLEDKFLAGDIRLSNRSTDRIKYGNKPLNIESTGLRDNASTTNFITRQSRRFNERYQFAAEKVLNVECLFKAGFSIEAGDSVLFGSPALQVSDITQGDRLFKPRNMEVINKSLSITTGKVKLDLLDTIVSGDARYGVISPNSFIDAGSTTTSIKLKTSFTTTGIERNKWSDMIGEDILIRSQDFSFQEVRKLLSFDPADDSVIVLETALSVPPSVDYLVDLPVYNAGTDKMKSFYCFQSPRIAITAGVSTTIFTVGAGDISKFFVGGFVRVHNEDFTVDSTPTGDLDDLEITDITGNDITVDRDMGFTASSSEFASIVGFASDEGLPYRFV
jgi:hypothetical protein